MKIALFGGSFDPVHPEHVRLACAARAELGLDRLFVIPSHLAPHKAGGAAAGDYDRLEMCRIAFRGLPFAEVSDCEIAAGGTSYSYLTCRRFAERYPAAERYFLVGADMLENFFSWKNPDEILRYVTLVACGRGELAAEGFRERFSERFGKQFISLPYTGADVSSCKIRVELAFGRCNGLDEEVFRYIKERGLYSYPAVAPALALEKPARREHSFRVACMAAERAKTAGVPQGKAILASALHDCAKYVPADSPLLRGFSLPDDVPQPVVHQFTGAFLAEHTFGVEDEEILDAIRYHASGREDMTALGKLVYLADLLEPSRDFKGVAELRKLFWEDLDRCLYESLASQIAYLRAGGKTIYPLTERAFLWIKSRYNG